MDATTPNSPPTPQNDETPIPQNNKTPIPQNDAVTQQNEENPILQNDTVMQPINNEIEETPIAQNDAVKLDVNQIEETPIPENDAVSREINAIEETPIPENPDAMLQNEENGETPIRQIDDIMRESNEIEGTPIAEDDAAVEKYNGIEETPNCENEVVKRETDRNEEKSITENDVLMREAEENDETQQKPNFGIDDAMVVDKKEEDGETPSRNGNVGAVGVEVGNGSNGNGVVTSGNNSKKKKKSNCVWIMRSSRKSKKRAKFSGNGSGGGNVEMDEERVLITPVTRVNPEKEDDRVDMNICLSKVFKAEKVELSEDRLTAGSCKGYRMVRATRGVVEGAWYFEIKVVHLGETGHTRLGWSNEKGDLQAPVGYDENSFGYRDTDGSKIHKALREGYGAEGYKEGDVIGYYISLPNGGMYAPKPQKMVLYKGQQYYRGPAESADQKEDVAKIVPGSVISFFKNGICQGVAYKDISGGRYYPAASMYTLPNQSNCLVRQLHVQLVVLVLP